MNLLTRLLGVDAPGNTELISSSLAYRSMFPAWLAYFFILLLAAGVFILYARESGTMGWVRRAILILLRSALLGLIVLLLLRPVLLANFRGERARPIVFLLDVSKSMKQQDRRMTNEDKLRVAIAKNLKPLNYDFADLKSTADLPPDLPKDPARADMAKWMLTHPELKLVEKLEKQGPIRPLLFGKELRGPDELTLRVKKGEKDEAKTVTDVLLANLDKTFDEKTALKEAINDVLQKKDSELPAAMVIVTDGQDNVPKFSFQDIAAECRRLEVPLYIYGVGSSEAGSLQLKEVIAADTLFVDDTVPVMVRWAAQGFKKGTVEIEVKLAGKQVAKKELEVQNGQDLRQILSFKLEKGFKNGENVEMVTSVRLKGSDQFKDEIKRQVRMVDDKINVLVIENSPRFEFKFLQPALHPTREKRFKVKFLLINADPKVANDPSPDSPFLAKFPATREKFFDAKYNVIILGDVPPSFLTKEQQEWIKEFVEKRGGLIVVAGRQYMPSQYVKTPFAELLPVDFNAVKSASATEERSLEYPPTLTDLGQRSPMLMLDDSPEENLKIWQSLPGFYWQYPVTKLRPGASALVVNPRAKIPGTKEPMPLVAMQYYGHGQVLFCGSDETWRWRFNVQDKYFVRYWGQLIYQMGLPHFLGENGKRAVFALQNAEPALGTPCNLYVRLVDKEFNPRKDREVEATLEHVDAKPGQERFRKILLTKHETRDGEYRYMLPNEQAGRFELKLDNQGIQTFSYRVDIPQGNELEEIGLNEKVLRTLAQDSGGRFYREEDLYKLPEDIKNEFTVILDGIHAEKKGEALEVAPEKRDKLIKAVLDSTGLTAPQSAEIVSGVPRLLNGVVPKDATDPGSPKRIKDNISRGEADKIKADLEAAGGKVTIHEHKLRYNVRQEVVLWNPLVMFLFIGLITAEWLVRKFSNLS